jgi:hypothetical protein
MPSQAPASTPLRGALSFEDLHFRYDERRSVMVALNKHAQARTLALDRFDRFLRGRSARDALTGKPVALGESLRLPGKSATLLEIE